jgi:hypothetical protein
MLAPLDTGPAGDAEIRLEGDVLPATVVAKFNGADRNAGVAIDATLLVNSDNLG